MRRRRAEGKVGSTKILIAGSAPPGEDEERITEPLYGPLAVSISANGRGGNGVGKKELPVYYTARLLRQALNDLNTSRQLAILCHFSGVSLYTADLTRK
jgi:hypothetical protein